jgi:hypothetical protein
VRGVVPATSPPPALAALVGDIKGVFVAPIDYKMTAVQANS